MFSFCWLISSDIKSLEPIRPADLSSESPGKDDKSFKPKTSKNFSVVPHVKGLPGDFLLPFGLIHYNSKRLSKVPFEILTPLIFSISALVTG